MGIPSAFSRQADIADPQPLMILYSNSSQNKLDKYPNTQFRPEEMGSIFLERHSYPTFATPFCNDAVCPVFSYF